MKIIEQLSEDTFVVKMDECDLRKEDVVKVAHDYVEFSGNVGMTTESGLSVTGKYTSCSNWIKQYVDLQIPIREMIKVILPYLNKHPYCRPEHLQDSEGKPAYYHVSDNIVFFRDEIQKNDMVAIRIRGEEEFTVITRKLYNYLKNE